MSNAETETATMSERELKDKINRLRTQISQKEKTLNSVFEELKLYRNNIDELKKSRDELNAQVKELVSQAKDLKSKRDENNRKIAELKNKRAEIQKENKSKADEIAQLKKKRNELNDISKGTEESLSKAYSQELNTFLNEDIPLNHEIDLFNKLEQLKRRLDAAQEANNIHQKIQEIYNSSFYEDLNELNNQIQQLADESQEYHLQMVDLFNKADEVRSDADSYHEDIKNKYSLMSPLKSKIDPLKSEISQLREELDEYLKQLDDIQLKKDEKNQDEKHTAAKEKLDKSGRLSLEDLKILMERGDL